MLRTKTLDDELAALIGVDGTKVTGLGVVAFKDGREVYANFFGRRHINPDLPVTRDTLFRAASVSKMFTAFTIMQLVERGRIDLRADVSEYLGFKLRNPNFRDVPITIEMLASHTSGLRDGKIYSLPSNFGLKEFFTAGGVAYEDGGHFSSANEPPAKFFRYCNLNYGILGTVVERVTGERFDLYQKKNILRQLQIGGDYVVGNLDEKNFANLGTLYQKNFATMDDFSVRPPKNFVDVQNPYAPDAFGSCDVSGYAVGTNATIFSPQGGLRLSFGDLSNCLEFLINRGTFRGQKILSEASFAEMISPRWVFDEKIFNGDTFGGVMENYGLGTYKIGGSGRARLCKNFSFDLIGHGGEAFGMISGIYFRPNGGDGVAFMSNGTAIDVDTDERSRGNFGASYVWEENVIDAVCRHIFAENFLPARDF